MAINSSPDPMSLEKLKQTEERSRQDEERTRMTTFMELIRLSHVLLSQPMRVGELSKSTAGTIPAPAGKYCPKRLQPWTDCPAQQQELYDAVCGYLQSEDAPRLFPPLIELEGHHRRLTNRPVNPWTSSQVTFSPSSRQEARNDRSAQSCHDAQFAHQRRLLGLQTGEALDDGCPNVTLHRRSQDNLKHLINAEDLMRTLTETARLLEHAGHVPFKLTHAVYGYTVVGKGTTKGLWKEVSREAQIYHILRKVQGSAVPVFLGTIDLALIYFHDTRNISHMLFMGWG
ncbi:hypothetical protein N7517_003500 [Penicillium concentricum]|uniref:Uncharacterized protein n=1 Tax=Penicillium concentricum TaxID=293559 RepID=A0A9W9VM10_9EURO|nr:uncharacterized protein N7517_003500 [Penicillium concentricum]KAJ5385589.1 hypothetical protein N7517_003500 [Penicillium concentricum]